MIKGAIFDLDGTILDTLSSLEKAGNLMLSALGFPPAPKAEYGYFAGNGMDVLVERALCYNGDTELIHYEQAKQLYREYLREYCNYAVKPFDGILTLLDELKNKNILTAVCTNKPHETAVAMIEKHFGKNTFSMILGQKDDFPKKPDPAGVLKILNKWNILPEECLYTGDSDVDMLTGKSAGTLTVGVLWGFRSKEELLENGADGLAETPLDLLKFIQ